MNLLSYVKYAVQEWKPEKKKQIINPVTCSSTSICECKKKQVP